MQLNQNHGKIIENFYFKSELKKNFYNVAFLVNIEGKIF